MDNNNKRPALSRQGNSDDHPWPRGENNMPSYVLPGLNPQPSAAGMHPTGILPYYPGMMLGLSASPIMYRGNAVPQWQTMQQPSLHHHHHQQQQQQQPARKPSGKTTKQPSNNQEKFGTWKLPIKLPRPAVFQIMVHGNTKEVVTLESLARKTNQQIGEMHVELYQPGADLKKVVSSFYAHVYSKLQLNLDISPDDLRFIPCSQGRDATKPPFRCVDYQTRGKTLSFRLKQMPDGITISTKGTPWHHSLSREFNNRQMEVLLMVTTAALKSKMKWLRQSQHEPVIRESMNHKQHKHNRGASDSSTQDKKSGNPEPPSVAPSASAAPPPVCAPPTNAETTARTNKVSSASVRTTTTTTATAARINRPADPPHNGAGRGTNESSSSSESSWSHQPHVLLPLLQALVHEMALANECAQRERLAQRRREKRRQEREKRRDEMLVSLIIAAAQQGNHDTPAIDDDSSFSSSILNTFVQKCADDTDASSSFSGDDKEEEEEDDKDDGRPTKKRRTEYSKYEGEWI